MIERRIKGLLREVASLLTRSAQEPGSIEPPEGMHQDLLPFVGTNINDEYGLLRIQEENGCREGTCVDVILDARPSPWERGTYLHGHLLASNRIRPGWQVIVVDGQGMGSEQDFLEVLGSIRSRLVDGVQDTRYLKPESRFK